MILVIADLHWLTQGAFQLCSLNLYHLKTNLTLKFICITVNHVRVNCTQYNSSILDTLVHISKIAKIISYFLQLLELENKY